MRFDDDPDVNKLWLAAMVALAKYSEAEDRKAQWPEVEQTCLDLSRALRLRAQQRGQTACQT